MGFATAAAIVAGAAAVTGSVVGGIKASKDRAAAKDAASRALAQIESVGAPPDQSAQILLKEFKSAGILTPELETNIIQGFSKLAQTQEDPKMRDAQLQSLQQIQQTSRTGLNATDVAALNKIRQSNQTDLEAKRQQIIQNMQARGQGGSGAELAAALQASQAGADSQSQQGDQVAAQAQQRALQAMTQAGQLSGNIRQQDWSVQQAQANAADEMNRFNVQNAINQQDRNVNRNNQASQYNLQNAQALQNANTSQYNQELQRQRDAVRQNYLDRMNSAQAQANALTGNATQLRNDANFTAQRYQNAGTGAAAGIGAVANAALKNPSNKQTDNINFKDEEGYNE